MEANALAFDGDTTAVLHDTVDYGPDQYVFVTLVDDTPYFNLALRSDPTGGLYVYADIHAEGDEHVHIGIFDGDYNDLTFTSVMMMPGDRIAFTVIADVGSIYINDRLVDSASLEGTPLAGMGGRIGIASLTGLGPTLIDDFGGGDASQ